MMCVVEKDFSKSCYLNSMLVRKYTGGRFDSCAVTISVFNSIVLRASNVYCSLFKGALKARDSKLLVIVVQVDWEEK